MSAWAFVRLWSIPVAVGMCVAATVIPPIAAMVANARAPEDRWWDDPSGDPKSDEWWDELDGKKHWALHASTVTLTIPATAGPQ